MRLIVILVLAGGMLLPPVAADSAPEEKTGLKVGEKAPAFAHKDQAGKEVTLEDLRKDADLVAIVFHRSASW